MPLAELPPSLSSGMPALLSETVKLFAKMKEMAEGAEEEDDEAESDDEEYDEVRELIIPIFLYCASLLTYFWCY